MGLHEKELWKKFHEAGTEMIITKAGRSALGDLLGGGGDGWEHWGSPGLLLAVLSVFSLGGHGSSLHHSGLSLRSRHGFELGFGSQQRATPKGAPWMEGGEGSTM